MPHLQELQRLLKPYFSFSSARLECLSHFIIGLLAVNDVNRHSQVIYAPEMAVDSPAVVFRTAFAPHVGRGW